MKSVLFFLMSRVSKCWCARYHGAVSRAKRQCVVLGDERTMAGRPGTDWFAIRACCKREDYAAENSRWRG